MANNINHITWLLSSTARTKIANTRISKRNYWHKKEFWLFTLFQRKSWEGSSPQYWKEQITITGFGKPIFRKICFKSEISWILNDNNTCYLGNECRLFPYREKSISMVNIKITITNAVSLSTREHVPL